MTLSPASPTVRRSITAGKVFAALVLVEQGAEALLLHVSLAEHPLLVIAALGALGFPIPSKE
jgi:hypothetical protein